MKRTYVDGRPVWGRNWSARCEVGNWHYVTILNESRWRTLSKSLKWWLWRRWLP